MSDYHLLYPPSTLFFSLKRGKKQEIKSIVIKSVKLKIWLPCSLFAALSYGIASMAMVFINKAIIMQYPHSMTLLTLQVFLFLVFSFKETKWGIGYLSLL